MQDPGGDTPSLAPPEQGDPADVDQFPDRHHAADGDRDQRAEREALSRQRCLQTPGEGGVADAEPGRTKSYNPADGSVTAVVDEATSEDARACRRAPRGRRSTTALGPETR